MSDNTDVRRQEVRSAAEAKAHELGYTGEVQVIRQHERSLRDGGIALDLDVLGLSMLSTTVDWYLDLGVLRGDTRRRRLTPGRKQLIPDGRLASLQTRIRTNFYAHSHEVTMLGGYRYMSDAQFSEWHPKHLELVEEFEQVKAEYINDYDHYVSQCLAEYRQMARETYAALEARGDDAEKEFTRQFTLRAFQNAVANKVLSKIPSRERMMDEIRVVIRMATWMLPVEQAADDLAREQAREEVRRIREEADTFMRYERALAEQHEQLALEAKAKARAAQREADEKERLLKAQTDEQIERERAETAAIKAAQLELAREAVKEMISPFDEMLNGVRAEVLGKVRKIRDNINKRGFVAGKQVEAIRNLVGNFRVMNTANDEELETMIQALADSLDLPGTETKRNTGAIANALEDIVQTCLIQAEAVVEDTNLDMFALLDL